jgi:phosphohistidine swiveling domain-containing protein
MAEILSLDDVETCDPAVVGIKASNLARARSAGMPVLPGWVVPAGESADAMRAGAEAFDRSGWAAACLAVADAEVDGRLRRRLFAISAVAGNTLVVRSSTPFDDDPRWSGAFATYLDVPPADLPAAVRGCWASVFTRDATGRGERLGLRSWAQGVAVLLQPYAAFDVGGTATIGADGVARLMVAAGGPAGIMEGGLSGTLVEIAADTPTEDVVGPAPADPRVLAAAAALGRTVRDEMGDDAIEWGAVAGSVILLQTGRAAAGRSGRPPARRPAPWAHPEAARRLAVAADRCPAPLGDALVLPWAAAMSALPETPVFAIDDVPAALEEARDTALRLASQAWAIPGMTATAEAAATFRVALGPHPEEAWERLAGLRPVDPVSAARVLGLVGAVGRRLARAGLVSHADAVWRRSASELDHAVSTARMSPTRSGADRWEAFVFDVVQGTGREQLGTRAAPGIGAGRPIVVRGPDDLTGIEPRRVLALRWPVPQVAPLVWSCSAIVSAGGSPGAHLFEVARSLGVPAVVGVDLMQTETDTLVAVDGTDGRVMSWKPSLDACSEATSA